MIEQAEPLIMEWLNSYGFIGIIVLLFLCTYGFPFSKNIIIITGGILYGEGVMSLPVVFIACSAGLFAGDFSLYILARVSRERVLRLIDGSSMELNFAKAEEYIRRYGLHLSVFLARFIPYIRTPIYISAGLFGVRASHFVILDLISIYILVPFLVWAGYSGSQVIENESISWWHVILVLLVISLIILLFRSLLRDWITTEGKIARSEYHQEG